MKDEYSAGSVTVGAVPGSSMEVDGDLSVSQTIQHHPPQQSFSIAALQQAVSGMFLIYVSMLNIG